MTADNIVTCYDDVERPVAECVEFDGDWYPSSECVNVSGDMVPRDQCRQDYNGEWGLAEEMIELADGDWAFSEDDSICCCHDSEYRFTDDCTLIGDEWYPDHMVRSCDCCGEPFLRNDLYSTIDGQRQCEDCHSENYTECAECGSSTPRDTEHYGDDGYHYCDDCGGSARLVVGYSDKSANKLRPESKDQLLYGVELEVESKTDQQAGAQWVRDRMSDKYCVLKHDGSLGDTGFEIVTRPDSMAVHRRMFAAILDDNPGKRLRSWIGGRCGMHVHVTKAALSQLQLAKMLCFLNDPGNAAFVSAVAGRLPCSWCKVSPKKMSDVRHNPDRYVALNITAKTAEFRIFRGTLLASSFLKNLEFVEALVAYCAPAQRSIASAVSHGDFCRWLDKKSYPYLWNYLGSKGYASLLIRKAG